MGFVICRDKDGLRKLMNAAWRLEVNDDFVEAGSVDLRFLCCDRCSYGVGHFFIRRFCDCGKTLGMDDSLRNYMARLLHFGMACFPREISSSTAGLPLVGMSYLPQELETFSINPPHALGARVGHPRFVWATRQRFTRSLDVEMSGEFAILRVFSN